MDDPELSVSKLRADFAAAVEAEMSAAASGAEEVSEEEYVALARQAWARLYSCALQYHQAEVREEETKTTSKS